MSSGIDALVASNTIKDGSDPSIGTAFNNLDQVINSAHEVKSRLYDKLEPILTPASPAPTNPNDNEVAAKYEERSEMRAYIDRLTRDVLDLHHALAELASRVDL